MNNNYKRLLSIILLISFIFTTSPTYVLAETLNNNNNSNVYEEPIIPQNDNYEKILNAKILKEVEEKREENVKYFLKEDFSYEAAVYPFAVHYKENGKWKDVDNTLVESSDEGGNAFVENKQNDYKIKISKNVDSEKLINIKKDKYEITWNMKDSQTIETEQIQQNIEKTVQGIMQDDIANNTKKLKNSSINIKKIDTTKLEKLTDNEKKKTLTKVSSEVVFPDIYENVDLVYEVKSEAVKETIVINNKIDDPEFHFNLKTKNLIPEIQEDKSIVFYDTNDISKIVFTMDAPFMVDGENEISTDIEVKLTEVEEGYVLSILPSREWLNSDERVYPVKIDPTVSTSADPNKIFDSHVSQNYPTTKYHLLDFVKTGKGSSSGINRTYIKFDLPEEITSSDIITNAYFGMNLHNDAAVARQVDVHKVSADWIPSEITWNNKPDYNTSVEEYQTVQGIISNSFLWNITAIAKEWYSTGNNYGLMLKNHDETTGYTEFHSSDTTATGMRPVVIINYVNNSGLEGYWTYHSQSVGRAGTGYVNDNSGNLVFVHNDLSMNGNRMPLTLSHVYNSNEVKNDYTGAAYGYGNGWRLNLSQRIVSETIEQTQYYVYTDEDGTRHYLTADTEPNTYKDETGIDITMTVDSGSTTERYKIKDKGDNELAFTSTGYLYKVSDNNGNTLTLGYNGETLINITDGAGRVTTLDVIDNNYLVGIIDPAGRRTSFTYNGAQLYKITYPDGKFTTYAYDNDNNLTTVTNHDGYKMIYTYYASLPYRIKKIEEGHTDGTQGQEFNLNYGNNETTFTDYEGKKNIYHFNNAGNTISIRDDYGNALYYEYEAKDPNDKDLKNKLSLQSKLQKPIMNYLMNHGAEVSGYWSGENDATSTGSSVYSTDYKYIGNQSIKVEKTNNLGRHFFSQYPNLEKGKTYTFSAYIKTDSILKTNGKGAKLFVNYQDETGAWQTANSEYINGTKDWERYEIKFTLPANAASTTVCIRAGIDSEIGTAYFDAFQLEKGVVANRYNILENPNLDYTTGTDTPYFWNKNDFTNSSDTSETVPEGDTTYPTMLDSSRKVFKFTGEADKDKSLFQQINISGKKGDVFVVSGWAKADSVPITSTRNLGLDIAIIEADGGKYWEYIPFNEDSNEWQYVSKRIVLKEDYQSITFYCLYYENANTAYFDGIQLYKEKFGQSYTYDENGNVVSTADLAEQKSTFKYNGNNEIEEMVNPNQGVYKYTYDTTNKHNIKTATSAENIVYSFEYDSYGNTKTAKVGGAELFINSTAEYTTNGNYINSIEDSSGNRINYNYNETKGTLESVTDAKGKTTSYTYDANLDRLLSVSKNVDGQEITNSYTYEDDRIKTITHNGFNYNFEYDSLGNNEAVNVGSQNLITNTYEDRSGKLKQSVYGNGDKVAFVYDDEDRVISEEYNGVSKYTYEYDANGNIGRHYDVDNNTNYKYNYDMANRLAKITDSNGNIINYDYDIESNLSGFNEIVDGKGYITNYGYDKDNKIKDIYYNNTFNNGENMEYFPLNGSTKGSKGTKPYSEISVFETDEHGKTVLGVNDINKTTVIYDLGINKNAGTFGLWFKTNSTDTGRYLINSKGANNEFIDMYIGADNKLKFAVRNTSGLWSELKSSTVTVNPNTWNYAAFTWNLNGNTLEYALYLNNNVYTGTTSDFQDFTGAKTSIGRLQNDSSPYYLNGQTEKFTFYNTALSNTEVDAIYQRGRGNRVQYNYDDLGRLENKKIDTGKYEFTTSFEYKEGATTNSTTTRVKKINNNGDNITYDYDPNGNIKTITEARGQILYYYNELNELIQEDNQILDKTILYYYDKGGNITRKQEIAYGSKEKTNYYYQYNDTNWKDKLTSYDGKAITYDSIGNPLSYDGWTFAWEKGRKLKSLDGNGYDIDYKYNSSGIRTEKTVNGVTTKYHLAGDKVTYETNGWNEIYYTYSSGGTLISMNLNGSEFYYKRNAQGDIIGLFNKYGTEVVSYTYDSWGKLISIDGVSKDYVGIYNPYRYRGYRYDSETELYYLNSRYYNPCWSRFINADSYGGSKGEILSHNAFIYCLNNPVNMQDQSGKIPKFLKDAWNTTKKVFKGIYTSLEIQLGLGAGVGVSQKSKFGPEEIGFEATLAAERYTLKLDDGEFSAGSSVQASASVNMLGMVDIGKGYSAFNTFEGSRYIDPWRDIFNDPNTQIEKSQDLQILRHNFLRVNQEDTRVGVSFQIAVGISGRIDAELNLTELIRFFD